MMLSIPTDFTFREKQAILAMLFRTAGCDGRIGNREYLFFLRVANAFGMSYEERAKAENVFKDQNWQSEMYIEFRKISAEHKHAARSILKRMVEIDENAEKIRMYGYLTL